MKKTQGIIYDMRASFASALMQTGRMKTIGRHLGTSSQPAL